MSTTSPDLHVRFDTHPAHPSAVTAHLTGTLPDSAHALLTGQGFEPLDEHTMVLVRIDHEEPYWANQADQELTGQSITTEITPRLREAIHEEWTWAEHPMSWLTRSEIRDVSNEAQQIHDDIRHGHLIIHAHADDHGTTVAVGTYRSTGQSVYLHGENHLRCVAGAFDSIADALTAFEHAHRDTLRPGPAPMTDTEHQAAHARTSLQAASPPTAPVPVTEEVPSYAADPADHDALLNTFLSEHGDWEKWRTWSDETTHAIHESQTLRIERVHEAHPRETAWTVAAYETPVSDRMWHLTATGTAAPMLQALLNHLADGDGWDTVLGSPIDEKTFTAATKPLADAGWQHTVDGRWFRWTNASQDAGVQFDAFAAQQLNGSLATWSIWAGTTIDQPTWTIHASPYAPALMIADLAEELAHGTGTRRFSPSVHRQPPRLTATAPAIATTLARPQASRSR
ncbi:DUF317 domain-containing protein [Streptomyces sp. GQFP]|uniref:DUF317 domain-containing protein n=1 Tax=Streptomyces sp. GQFP TaxID=2907545 RepID=UPI001F26FC6B|nr:DUF317 domain-containing protein [Streptomyces sp. GQFP]UIX34359.1 DUF317 domain-containing protein [Streptomyces sp. GQFP]